MTEKRIIVLGTIQIPEVGESIAFDLPSDLDPAKVTEALEKLEADRAVSALRRRPLARALCMVASFIFSAASSRDAVFGRRMK
jgi:hypothetical protein